LACPTEILKTLGLSYWSLENLNIILLFLHDNRLGILKGAQQWLVVPTEISEWNVRCHVPHDQPDAAVNHINAAALVTTLRTALFLAASAMASEGLAAGMVAGTYMG